MRPAVVMGLNGGKAVTLQAGDTFHERPEDVHTVERNASGTKPARFVVFLIKNKGVPVLTPVKQRNRRQVPAACRRYSGIGKPSRQLKFLRARVSQRV